MSPGCPESAAEAATRHWPVNRPCPALAGDAEPRVYPRTRPRTPSGFLRLTLLGLLVLAARSLPAQAIGQGFELERAGQYEQAAGIYLATLRADPTNLSALLGLERVLPRLNRLGELLPAAQRAAAASPTNAALRGVLLRTYVALNEPDSGRAVALRWAAAAPRDEAPCREWARALEDAHRHAAARDVLLVGRRALGRPGAFGIELAELSRLSGDWEGAAREWAAALEDAPVQLPNAASALAEAPDAARERIARLLTAGTPSPLTRRLAGELLLGWGQPQRAWAVFEPSVATPSADAAFALRRFADLASARSTPDARRVRALALARYADLTPEPGGAAARARADAARAFIDAGDRAAARAVLERVAQDSSAPADAQRLALLQQVPADSFRELGGALLLLAQGDSLHAVQALRLAAGRLATGAGGGGRPDLLLLAGRVAARLDSAQQQTALALFDEIVHTAGEGAAAPAAELEWARLLERRAQAGDAMRPPEHLILTYPGSAVVPEARRELERAKGAIPKS